MASPTSVSRVPKACDPCNRRKVRCNGQQRCQQCEHLDLLCTYTENRSARSRKHSLRRGAVISKYKSDCTAKTTALMPRLSPLTTRLPISYFESLIPDYMSYVYPFSPIITDTEVLASITKMDTEREHAAFIYAFTAVTLDLTRSSKITSTPPSTSQITDLMRQSVEIQQPLVIGFRPSILRAMTSIFIQMCAMSLGHYDLGFFYLREAISMIQILRISDKTVLAGLCAAERARRQRLYWQCFIHERFMSIVYFSPVALSPAEYPEEDTTTASVSMGIQQGWTQVIKTFCMLDASFISHWIGDRSQVTASWVEGKHRELDDELWEVEVSVLSELQQADLVITRQWMRTLLWQMAMSNCLLSSHASCPSLELEMPLRLSSQLRQFLTKISQNTIRVHGSSMVSKLLEIINTIADVVIHVPQATREETTERIDDIVFMQGVVFSFHNLQAMSKNILLDKFRLIQGRFPHIEVAMKLAV